MSTANTDHTTTEEAAAALDARQELDTLAAAIKSRNEQIQLLVDANKADRDRATKIRGAARAEDTEAKLTDARAKADARIAKIQDAQGDCWCGCGIPHAIGRRFLQGHDARFWAMVTKIRDGRDTLTENTPERVKEAVEGEWSKYTYGPHGK